MTSIFEGQPPKTSPFPTKTRVIWVPGIYKLVNALRLQKIRVCPAKIECPPQIHQDFPTKKMEPKSEETHQDSNVLIKTMGGSSVHHSPILASGIDHYDRTKLLKLQPIIIFTPPKSWVQCVIKKMLLQKSID